MGKHRSNVRLFAPDGYTFKCWIDPDEAREKFDRGELDLATNPASGVVIGYKLREAFETSDPTRIPASQSSITLAEMLLNVGLPSRSKDSPSTQAIAAAQTKITLWPFIWDEQATCVRRVELL